MDFSNPFSHADILSRLHVFASGGGGAVLFGRTANNFFFFYSSLNVSLIVSHTTVNLTTQMFDLILNK